MSKQLPREHGAYVVLATSLLLGLIVGAARNWPAVVLAFISSIAMFLAQQPIRQIVLRRRSRRQVQPATKRLTWILLPVALLSFLALAWLRPVVLVILPPMLLLGAILFEIDRRRGGMTDLSIAGFPALALGAPLVYLASVETVNFEIALLLWGIATTFFWSSVACVNVRLRGERAIAPALWFHALLLLATALLVTFGMAPPVTAAASGIAIARMLFVMNNVNRYRRLPLKRIGIVETIGATLLLATVGMLW